MKLCDENHIRGADYTMKQNGNSTPADKSGQFDHDVAVGMTW
jgi:hypothetical protein